MTVLSRVQCKKKNTLIIKKIVFLGLNFQLKCTLTIIKSQPSNLNSYANHSSRVNPFILKPNYSEKEEKKSRLPNIHRARAEKNHPRQIPPIHYPHTRSHKPTQTHAHSGRPTSRTASSLLHRASARASSRRAVFSPLAHLPCLALSLSLF